MQKEEDNFDPSERIAGFALVQIKKVLGWVGIMDDRDDVASTARALRCSPQQALRVLEELERRGYVTKEPKPKQWKTTAKGHRLGFYWQPPRRFTPAIDRTPRRGIIEGCESTRCGILRSPDDQEDMFEEAELESAMNPEYEGNRLVEVIVSQPDDYDDKDGSGSRISLSVFLSPSEARRFVAGLEKAIVRAETELVRRGREDARKRQREEDRRRAAVDKAKKRAKNPTRTTERTAQAASAVSRDPATHARSESAPAAEASPEQRRTAIANSLKDLREKNRSRRTPASKAE